MDGFFRAKKEGVTSRDLNYIRPNIRTREQTLPARPPHYTSAAALPGRLPTHHSSHAHDLADADR